MKFIDMIYKELKESCWLICSYHYSYTPISLYTEFQPPSINETKSFYLKCPHQNQNTTFRHDHVTPQKGNLPGKIKILPNYFVLLNDIQGLWL